MQWKQFLTPVKSCTTNEARTFFNSQPEENYTLLDVRQPGEYSVKHLPGSVLIPLPELADRIKELDTQKPVYIYCATGGRSRVAAQMLAGRGFAEPVNMKGGIKAWEGAAAIGDPELGMELFSGAQSPEEAVLIAFGMEVGLESFYKSLAENTPSENGRKLFLKLAAIEQKHQQRLVDIFKSTTGKEISVEELSAKAAQGPLEGGLSSDEYLDKSNTDLTSVTGVIELAMSIEAQALDLYLRASRDCSSQNTARLFLEIAEDEKKHLVSLGELMDANL